MLKSENKKLALSLVMLIIGMSLLAYSSVPLYNLFCKVTGYGGTTQIAKSRANHVGSRKLEIRFDANTSPELPWEFKPEQKNVQVITGENMLVFYFAHNKALQPIIGTAVYNVTPHKAGKYFNKIQCFCFSEQLLTPNQQVHMPVSFFIDPDFDNDPEMKDVNVITLSYSFFKVK
jgi:cytochrome c oxidase assembly protein subunit 11